MGDLIPIHKRRIFTVEEAEKILPVVKRITEKADEAAKEIEQQLKFVPEEEPLYKRLKNELETVVNRWALKIMRLGCEPRGVWLVDFDAMIGWYSWRLGDENLGFFHPYSSQKDASAADQILI